MFSKKMQENTLAGALPLGVKNIYNQIVITRGLLILVIVKELAAEMLNSKSAVLLIAARVVVQLCAFVFVASGKTHSFFDVFGFQMQIRICPSW